MAAENLLRFPRNEALLHYLHFRFDTRLRLFERVARNGVPKASLALSLFSFNAGVEIGQITLAADLPARAGSRLFRLEAAQTRRIDRRGMPRRLLVRPAGVFNLNLFCTSFKMIPYPWQSRNGSGPDRRSSHDAPPRGNPPSSPASARDRRSTTPSSCPELDCGRSYPTFHTPRLRRASRRTRARR